MPHLIPCFDPTEKLGFEPLGHMSPALTTRQRLLTYFKRRKIILMTEKNLPEFIPPFFLEHRKEIDNVVECGHHEHDLAEEDQLVPALVVVEQLDGFDAVPRFDAATCKHTIG